MTIPMILRRGSWQWSLLFSILYFNLLLSPNLRIMKSLTYGWRAGNFQLTNQDSAGGKIFTVLAIYMVCIKYGFTSYVIMEIKIDETYHVACCGCPDTHTKFLWPSVFQVSAVLAMLIAVPPQTCLIHLHLCTLVFTDCGSVLVRLYSSSFEISFGPRTLCIFLMYSMCTASTSLPSSQ